MSQPTNCNALLVHTALLAAPLMWCGEVERPREEFIGFANIEEKSFTVKHVRLLHARIDNNTDGKVSLPEIMSFASAIGTQMAAKHIGSIVQASDTSEDGRLSLDEYLNDIFRTPHGGGEPEEEELEVEAGKFRAADIDGDLLLDHAELAAVYYPETHEGVLAAMIAKSMRQKDVNKDEKLDPEEFWEMGRTERLDMEVSKEEGVDFRKLDKDSDGFLDVAELKAWQSGSFHTEEAMRNLMDVVDKDGDMHMTADEMAVSMDRIVGSRAKYNLIEWAEHLEL